VSGGTRPIPDGPLLLHVEAFWTSPWTCSAYVALREKGLPFTTALAMVSDETPQQAVRESSITGRIPALQHGSFWISESNTIVEYLDDRFPAPAFPRLLPEDLCERTRARQVMAWLRSDLFALRNECDAAGLFYPVPATSLSPDAQRDIEKLISIAERLVPEGATQMFRTWSVADLDLAFTLRRLTAYGLPLAQHLCEYARLQWERPSVRDWVRHPRPPFSNWRPLPAGRRP
jgi:glutathione S-transferase